MVEADATLAFALVIFVVVLASLALRWASINGFWSTVPAASTQPVWKTSPSVRSKLKIPDSKRAFLDIETETSGRVWCIGVCENKSLTVQFVARRPDDERRILEEFVHYAWSRKDFVFCYYGGWSRFDEVVLRARLRAFDLPYEFFVMKDLFQTVRSLLRLRRYGLKDVAARLGYRFSHWELKGGMIPVLWKRSIRTDDDELMQKLVEYNMDDAKALWYVVDWFGKNHPDMIGTQHVSWRTIRELSAGIYAVPSFRNKGVYKVRMLENRCSCPVSRECKHLQLVRELTRSELLAS